MIRALLLLLISLIIFESTSQAASEYWPQWRGPEQSGLAEESNPPVTWNETENVRWKVPVDGEGWSTPIIWGNRIFLHTAIP